MRISTSQLFNLSLNSILDTQTQLARSQLQISSGKRILAPSDDPIGAVQSVGLNRAVERTDQFQRNADQADSRLRLEEVALEGSINTLQRVHELALQAINASQNNETRDMIATEMREHLDSLLQFGNTRDSAGRYLFSGFQEDVQAFTRSGGSFVYNGDDGQRQLQIGPSRQVVTGDAGSDVFAGMREGNGTFATSADPTNTGIGIINGGSVSDPSLYDGDTYTIVFNTPADTYDVLDGGGGTVLDDIAFNSGDEITFNGISVTISGQPGDGDEFTVAPSSRVDVFTTLDELITALETGRNTEADKALQTNEINGALANIAQALDHITEVRSRVGARLRAIEIQTDINAGAKLQFQQSLSTIQDVDLAEAITNFNKQLVGLQASQQATARVQGLSLFNFL